MTQVNDLLDAIDRWRPARHLVNVDEGVRRVLREPALLEMNDVRWWST